MKEQVCAGILVLRLPNQNFDAEGRGAFSSTAPKIGDLFYGGVHRMPWFDVDEDYYQGSLPDDLNQLRSSLKADDFTGVNLCYDLEAARRMLAWSNRKCERNELVAVRSERLVAIKRKTITIEQEIQWKGFDFVSLGNWSLLADGLFCRPKYFAAWKKHLNNHGLMDDPGLLPAFARSYSMGVLEDVVEPLPEEDYDLDAIEVGSLV